MNLDACAYRAKDPTPIVATYDAFQAESKEHSARVSAWLESHTPAGRERRGGMYRGGGAWSGTPFLLGLAPYPNELKTGKYPTGWRKRVKDDYLTPHGERARNVSAEEREAAERIREEMAGLSYPRELRQRLAEFGMPSSAMRGSSINNYALRVADGQVYVYWAIPADVLEQGEEGYQRHRESLVDLGQWERLPLSQWYALLEAAEPAQARP